MPAGLTFEFESYSLLKKTLVLGLDLRVETYTFISNSRFMIGKTTFVIGKTAFMIGKTRFMIGKTMFMIGKTRFMIANDPILSQCAKKSSVFIAIPNLQR